MARSRFKRSWRAIWRLTKWAVGWPLAIFGFVGLPDQIGEWEDFIGRITARIHSVMTDPHVVYLAQKAVEIANFVNHPAVRVALVMLGVAIIIWGWRPFWDLRHRLIFAWRVFLGEETWIGREDAIKFIRASRWARMNEPATNIFEQIGRGFAGGRTDYERAMLLFEHHIEMTLESFERNHPSGVREVDGKNEYGETQLRSFINNALDAAAIKRFGDIPT